MDSNFQEMADKLNSMLGFPEKPDGFIFLAEDFERNKRNRDGRLIVKRDGQDIVVMPRWIPVDP